MATKKPAPSDLRTAAKKPLAKPHLEIDFDGHEHRQFPRAKMEMPFSLWIDKDGDRCFSATLPSKNLSVSGAFLSSTFFLPVGTELRVRFELEAENNDPVDARAEVVRQDTTEGHSGMALRFVEFFDKTEVTLARLFLAERLTSFADDYLSSKRAKSLTSELERVVDALAAWELLKVTHPGDIWAPDANEK